MPDLPSSTAALATFVFALGLRHGLDADHLAAVDALTRLHHQAGRRGTRGCGLRFALGHGAVVLVVALAAAAAREHWSVPPALELVGAWCSIALLLALGLLNLHALRTAPSGSVPVPVGLRGAWLAGRTPGPVALGALFALSFDTLGLALLFGLTGAAAGGAAGAAGLALLFAAGMALVDGLDGVWVAHLLRGAGPRAAATARALGWVVTLLSLGVAAWGAWRLSGAAGDASTPWPGLVVLGVVAAVGCATRHRDTTASGGAGAA